MPHRHFQNFGNVAVAVPNRQDLSPITSSITLAAFHEYIRKELHVDLDMPHAFALATTPTINIEAEMPRRVIVSPSVNCLCENLPDFIKRLDVGHRIRPGRTPDRTLINENNILNLAITEHF
jgi:hypothetical protein